MTAQRFSVSPCCDFKLLIVYSCLLAAYKSNNTMILGLFVESSQGSKLWLCEHSWESRRRKALFLEWPLWDLLAVVGI